MRQSGEGEKGRYLPWSKEEEGACIFWMKQVPVNLPVTYDIYMYNGGVYIFYADTKHTPIIHGVLEHLTIDKKCLRVCFFIATFSRRNWAGNTHEHIWSLNDRDFEKKVWFPPPFNNCE